MNTLALFPVLMVGLLGSVHCVGMCGGIVAAFSAVPPGGRPFPVAVAVQGVPRAFDGALRILAYNTGRIGSYAIAGALAGAASGGARSLAGLAGLQSGAYWLANLMLVALGLYLMGAWSGVTRLEALGQGLWRRIRPLTARIGPLDSPFKLLALGSLWGWLPCGMVYSVLFTAMLSGSAGAGAAVMLAFGLGTLPMLLAMGAAGASLRQRLQRPAVRIAGGMVVLGFGLLGLLRAMQGHSIGWLDALCLSGAVP